jgi:hypothetical protein
MTGPLSGDIVIRNMLLALKINISPLLLFLCEKLQEIKLFNLGLSNMLVFYHFFSPN